MQVGLRGKSKNMHPKAGKVSDIYKGEAQKKEYRRRRIKGGKEVQEGDQSKRGRDWKSMGKDWEGLKKHWGSGGKSGDIVTITTVALRRKGQLSTNYSFTGGTEQRKYHSASQSKEGRIVGRGHDAEVE